MSGDALVWCVDPAQTRHLQFLLAMPDDLGARATLRRHYECPGHGPGFGSHIRLAGDEYPRTDCANCAAHLIQLPKKWATAKHVGPRRMGEVSS